MYPPIPFCHSEFLQDFTIQLGLYLRSSWYRWGRLSVEVDTCEFEGVPLERLTIWIRSYYCTQTRLILWEDETVWVDVALLPTQNNERFEVGFYPDRELFDFNQLIEALAETTSVSTRLCYGESPEPIMRKIWKFNGKVKIEGTLSTFPGNR
jgi:hypothetical protein